MFTSKSTGHLAFISRQLSNLLTHHQLESALQRLSETSPVQYSKEIEYLRDLLTTSAGQGPTIGPNPYRTLSKLLPAVSDSKNTLFRGFMEYMQQSKVIFETYWVGIIGLIWYLVALSLVALIVTVVFSVFVVPSFSSLFTQFAAPMPNLTTAVFAISGSGIPVLAIALAFIVGLVVWFVVIFHRRIQQFTPLPRWSAWAPIVGKITESYNLGLFLNFTRMLRECNVEPARAVAVAASESNQPESLSYESMANNQGDFAEFSVLTELSVAARLGHFDSELAYQCDQHIGQMSVSLVEARDRFSLILKLALYLFVSTLVVAMYLPIFKIGAVI